MSLLRRCIGGENNYILTVKRRKSKFYSVPVVLVQEEDKRWLVAPYGEVNWVRNARADRQVTLTRGKKSERIMIAELGPEEGAPVLKKYLTRVRTVQPYFDIRPDAPFEAFAAEAPCHPVFHIR
jgi:hypothetical protein